MRSHAIFAFSTYQSKIEEFVGWEAFENDKNHFFWERQQAEPATRTPSIVIPIARSEFHVWIWRERFQPLQDERFKERLGTAKDRTDLSGARLLGRNERKFCYRNHIPLVNWTERAGSLLVMITDHVPQMHQSDWLLWTPGPPPRMWSRAVYWQKSVILKTSWKSTHWKRYIFREVDELNAFSKQNPEHETLI